MEVVERNINALAGLYARKKCSPVMGEISDAGLGAMMGKVLKANDGVQFNADTLAHDSEDDLLKGLRPELQKVIADMTGLLQTPWQISLPYMIGVAAICLGYKISCKWRAYQPVHANVLMVVVADSGGGKSDPLAKLAQPIEDKQTEAFNQYKRAMSEWKKNGKEGEKPHRRKYKVDDATIESIKRGMIFNKDGFAYIKDEGLLGFLGAYKDKAGQRNDDDEVIKMFECQPIEVSRASDEEDAFSADHSCLSIVGSTQTYRIPEYFGKERINHGLASRFFFSFSPFVDDEDEPEDDSDIDMSAWVKAADMMIKHKPTFLTFSDGAKELIRAYRKEMRHKKKDADWADKTLYAKLQVHILRLALIMHYLGPNYESDMIDADEMRYVVALMHFFEKQGLMAFSLMKQGQPKAQLSFYQAVHLDWDMLIKHSQQTNTPPPSQAEFARLHGIAPQNFSQKVLSANY